MSLPSPSGPRAVGTTRMELTDPTRPRHLLASAPGRSLLVRIWYPAAAHHAGMHAPDLVWSDLRRDPRTPGPARAILSLLRKREHARSEAPYADEARALNPVVYNHGMVSFASENASLMEDLASHGRVVLAIQHQDQLQELRALRRAQPAAEHRKAEQLAREMARASPAAKAALAHDYYRASPVTNQIVMERAADTSWVLDRMRALRNAIPGMPATGAIDEPHLVGFSLGGAVSTAVALRDTRARSVVNMDGGTQGPIDAGALQVPCLMLYSEANHGTNDLLLPPHIERETPAGTCHLNYHDLAGLMPVLRFTPALGRVDPSAFLCARNQTVRNYLQQMDARTG